jgi:hypothetical protein
MNYGYFYNATSGVIYNFTKGLPVDLTSVTSQHTIRLGSFDSQGWPLFPNYQEMCRYSFTPFNGSTFPDSLHIKNTTSDFDVTLYFTYVFN